MFGSPGPQPAYYVVTGTGCGLMPNFDTAYVMISPLPALGTNNLRDTTWVCQGGTLTGLLLDATRPQPNAYLWTPSWAFTNPTALMPTVSAAVTAPVQATLTLYTALNCPNVYHTLLMPAAIVPDSVYQCPGDSMVVSVGMGLYSGVSNVAWSPPGLFGHPNVAHTTVSVPADTVLTVTYTTQMCGALSDNVRVILHGLPQIAPDTLRACAGDTIALNVQDANPVVWGISGMSVGDSTSVSTWTVFQGTPFTLYVASCDSFFCPGFDSVLVTWLDAIPGPDTIRACLNDTIVIPGMSGGVSCIWSPMTDVLSTSNCTLRALPQRDRWYKLVWTDAGGCIAMDSVWVDIDSVSVTGQLLPPFSGNLCFTDSLQLHATGGTIIAWSPGTWLSNANIASPWAHAQSTQEYHVRISNGGTCFVEDSVTINVDASMPPGVLTASDTSICVGEPIKLVAQGGTSYLWTQSLPGGINGSTLPFNNVNPTATTTYAVTVSDGGICSWEDSVKVVVEACCYVLGAQQFHNARASDVTAYFNCPPGGCSGRPIHVIDTLTIDQTFTCTNCDIFMDSMAVILVPHGKTLTLSNCRVRAGCGYMWDGIYVADSTALCRVIAGSVIMDGIGALRSLNGGRFFLQNSTFRNNWVGLRVGPKAGIHAGNVTGTHFTSHSAQMLPPHAGRPGECGIWTEAVDSIRLGGNFWATRNTFDSLGIGIIAMRSNVWVTNSLFSAMNIQANVKGNPGYGHYGTGIVAMGTPGVNRPYDTWWMHVGGDSLHTEDVADEFG